jgi:hypothetical protein
MVQKSKRGRLEFFAYRFDRLEYGYKEEGGVDRGHHKKLPVCLSCLSSIKSAFDLAAERLAGLT